MNLFGQTTKFISVSALAFLGLVSSSTESNAQITYPYVADFETATTSPASKAYANTDPVVMNGLSWTMPGVYMGTMGDNDKRNGEKSGRMRLTANATGDPGSLYTNEDFPAGVGNVTVSLANYGSETGTVTVQYSIDGGTTWVDVETITPTETMASYPVEVNQPGNVRLKFLKDAENGRVNIDDITVTLFEDAGSIIAVSKSPVGMGIPVSTDELTIQYSHPIQAGSGSITVTHSASSETQVFTVPSASVVIDGDVATISGLVLENASSYYVTMTEGAFAKADDEEVVSAAITDPAEWTFTTIDETPAPVITELNESFTECIESDLTPLFNAYSVEGPKTWRCSIYGHDDDNAVYINGGSSAGVSEANQDWLISNNPINVTSVSNPSLKFWMKRRFEGAVDFKVKVSTDYTGTGDPTSATWTDLTAITAIPEEGSWVESDVYSLDAMTSNFYLAFVYTCGESGAVELTLDDIVIAGTTSVDNVERENKSLTVIGDATTDEINLHFNTLHSGQYTFQVIDLNGRVINDFKMNVQAGDNQVTLSPLNARQGVYIIRAITDNGSYIQPVKAVIR